MIKQLLSILLIFLTTGFAYAQGTSVIKGKIIDQTSGKPIAQVNIKMMPGDIGGSSDNDGNFVMSNMKNGDYSLVFTHLSYKTKELKITVDGKNSNIEVKMELDIVNLLAVEILDDKFANTPYSKTIIRKSNMDLIPVRDIGDFMREIPNVSAVRKGGANLDPVIRGFKFDQLNVIADNGLMVEGGCPNRMDPTTSHIDADEIEAIEVVKGPYALRFGPNMGGMVNLLTINPRPFDKFQLHVKGSTGYESNWNGQRQHITVLGGGKHVFFTLSGSNSMYGNYEDGDGNLVRTQFSKMGFNGKLGFSPAKNHVFYFTYTDFFAKNVSFPSLMMDEREDKTNFYSFDYNAKNISEIIASINVKAYKSTVDHTMDNAERSISDTAFAISQVLAERIGARAEAGLNVLKGHLFVGADFYKINKDGDRVKTMLGQNPTTMNMIPVKVENLWNSAFIQNFGIFGEYKKSFGSWEVVGALRFDMNSAYSDSISLMTAATPTVPSYDLLGINADSTSSNYSNISFNLGATKALNENMSLGLSFGRGVRSPNMIERFIILLPVGFDNYEYLGNPYLKPEVNNEVDLVFKYKHGKIGNFEVTGFYSRINDYIGGTYVPPTVQKPFTVTVLGVKKFDNLGSASVYGFEFGYSSLESKKLVVKASAAYSQGAIDEATVYTFDAQHNATSSEIVKNEPLPEIPPLDFRVNATYKLLNNRLIPGISFRHVAAQTKVSVSSNELTSESYNLMDLSLKYKHSEVVSVSGGIRNLFDTYYFEHLNRRILGTDLRIAEPGRVFYINLFFNI